MSKGYRCCDPITCHMYHSLDVTFLETIPFFLGFPSFSGPASELIVEEDSAPPHPLPILESPPISPSGSLPSSVTTDPSQDYPHYSHALAPLPSHSHDLGISSPLVLIFLLPVIPHVFVAPSFSSFKQY